MAPIEYEDGLFRLTENEKQSIRGKVILIQEGIPLIDVTLAYYGLIPVINLRTLEDRDRSLGSTLDDSRASLMLMHVSNEKQFAMVLSLSDEQIRKMLILKRVRGGVTEKMVNDYKKMERRGATMIDWDGAHFTDNLLFGIWQALQPTTGSEI